MGQHTAGGPFLCGPPISPCDAVTCFGLCHALFQRVQQEKQTSDELRSL